MGETWILAIISILSLIVHYKHILFIWRLNIDALVWQEKLFVPPFSLKSKFARQMGQT